MAKKRAPPDLPDPVEEGGIRYETVFGTEPDIDADGRAIAAYDAGTGARLWWVEVYPLPPFDPDMEADKQEIYISAMRLAPDGRHLEVEHERGARFRVDLETREVQPAGG